jgi:nucleotide-binding universal stress UspA family protein
METDPMTELEHVLVATDLSAPAGWAETRAGMLAAQAGADIDLLHVFGDSTLQALRQALVGTQINPDQAVPWNHPSKG